jgi:hypothetical protein
LSKKKAHTLLYYQILRLLCCQLLGLCQMIASEAEKRMNGKQEIITGW